MRRWQTIVTAVLLFLLGFAPLHADPDNVTYWLDLAAERAPGIRANDDRTEAQAAYLRANLFYRLALAEKMAGRTEQCHARMASLQEALAALPQDRVPGQEETHRQFFTYVFLHGINEVIQWPDAPPKPRKVSDRTRLHAAVVHADALLRTGDEEGYQQLTRAALRDLRRVDGPRTKPKDFALDGMDAAWRLAVLARDAKDLELASQLGESNWRDPVEGIVTLAIHGQVEGMVGKKHFGERYANNALEKANRLADQQADAGDILGLYRLDWDTAFAEALAAHGALTGSLYTGKEAARQHYGRDRSWLFSSMPRLVKVRRLGPRPWRNKLNTAQNVRFKDGPLPKTEDVTLFACELTHDGQRDFIEEVFFDRRLEPDMVAYAALGVAQAMLSQEKE